MEHIMNDDCRACGLSEAANAAVTVLAGLDAAERRLALEALGLAEPRRIWTPRALGDLPTMTALARDRDREAVYASGVWSSAYRGAGTLVIYVLQARGLGDLSASLGGLSLAKVGTTAIENLARRVADLGHCQYGAWMRGSRRYESAGGFEAFRPAPRMQLAAQHAASPVRLCTHGIEIDLPPQLSHGKFEAELNRALVPLRLQTVADSEAGRALCARAGIDAGRQMKRFYKAGGRFKAATEITLIRPQADLGALARIAQDIVIDAVLGLRSRRPAT